MKKRKGTGNEFMKKVTAVLFAAVLFFQSSAVPLLAETIQSHSAGQTGISELDALIAAGVYMNSNDTEGDLLPIGSYCEEIVPLYHETGGITAYYVKFTTGSYAVVNNQKENPSLIEFGQGDNQFIRELLNQYADPYIIYHNPFDIYHQNGLLKYGSEPDLVDIYAYYPDLLENNQGAVDMLAEAKAQILQQYPHAELMRGSGDYGFIDLSDMPSGSFSSKTIAYSNSVVWANMKDYNSIAENHCAATAVTNLALYFASRAYTDLLLDTTLDTFKAAHKIVGNGPVMTIADEAVDYFNDHCYVLKHSSANSISEFKEAVDKNRPCGVLLCDNIFSEWHWIIAIGYRSYSSDTYMQVITGWGDSIYTYYKPNSGSAWISCTQYYIE